MVIYNAKKSKIHDSGHHGIVQEKDTELRREA